MIRPYPLLLFFISILSILSLTYLFPSFSLYLHYYKLICIPFLLVGLLIIVKTIILFNKHKTTIHPFKTPFRLIQDGPFRYSRNPIYLSFLFILLALCIYLSNIIAFLVLVLFVFIMNTLIIEGEEKILEDTFGKKYKIYKQTTGRWLGK